MLLLTSGNQAQHIQRDDLTAKVEAELHEKLEEWGDIALELKYVYGLRLFRNQTTIKMHIDKKGSHALGYVLHVGSSNDYDGNNDPWPFLIEDFHGRTHEVFMQPGDLIFFESAKVRTIIRLCSSFCCCFCIDDVILVLANRCIIFCMFVFFIIIQ